MGNNLKKLAANIAKNKGIRPELFLGLINAESGFNPKAVSQAGAIGLGQLMPSTARGLGIDPTVPAQNLRGSATYLKAQLDRFGGDERKALAAYNAGPGAVQKYGGVPPYKETINYVNKVLGDAGSSEKSVSKAISSIKPSGHRAQKDDRRIALSRLMWGEDSPYTRLLEIKSSRDLTTIPTASGESGPSTLISGKAPTGKGYKGIVSFAKKNFGLNIQGDFQTISGKHDKDSLHYAGRAVDFGDATNSKEKLMKFSSWAKNNPNGIKEFFYDPAGFHIKNGKIINSAYGGHGDHAHIAT